MSNIGSGSGFWGFIAHGVLSFLPEFKQASRGFCIVAGSVLNGGHLPSGSLQSTERDNISQYTVDLHFTNA